MAIHQTPTPYGIATWHDDQAEGAMPNGTRIKKIFCEKGDANKIGTTGIVRGSMRGVLHDANVIGYFVFWDTTPNIPVFVAGFKIAPIIPH